MNALGKFEDQSHQKRAKFKLEKSKNSGKKNVAYNENRSIFN